MTPDLYAFVERITSLAILPARDELRTLSPEALVDLCLNLCVEVKQQSITISEAVKTLTN